MRTCIRNEKEGNTTKGVETPLIRSLDESTNESSGNHDLVHEDGVENGRRWQAAGQEEIQQQEGRGQEPVNVSDIEDLSHVAVHFGAGAFELNLDSGPSKVGAHTEVGDGRNQRDASSDIVEQAVRSRLHE